MSYCSAVRTTAIDAWNRVYHDTEYGFPLISDDELFERLMLEINQAGLSWLTILKKREGFRNAYAGFEVRKVARFGDKDRERLMADASIIRNRLKIDAAIHNAQVIQQLGGFAKWLDAAHPLTPEEWSKLFRKTFRFTGGEIVREFLVSTGYLPDAHDSDCPVHRKILKLKPAWSRL
jgi:DNA-3-methyladenine glycosylase I